MHINELHNLYSKLKVLHNYLSNISQILSKYVITHNEKLILQFTLDRFKDILESTAANDKTFKTIKKSMFIKILNMFNECGLRSSYKICAQLLYDACETVEPPTLSPRDIKLGKNVSDLWNKAKEMYKARKQFHNVINQIHFMPNVLTDLILQYSKAKVNTHQKIEDIPFDKHLLIKSKKKGTINQINGIMHDLVRQLQLLFNRRVSYQYCHDQEAAQDSVESLYLKIRQNIFQLRTYIEEINSEQFAEVKISLVKKLMQNVTYLPSNKLNDSIIILPLHGIVAKIAIIARIQLYNYHHPEFILNYENILESRFKALELLRINQRFGCSMELNLIAIQMVLEMYQLENQKDEDEEHSVLQLLPEVMFNRMVEYEGENSAYTEQTQMISNLARVVAVNEDAAGNFEFGFDADNDDDKDRYFEPTQKFLNAAKAEHAQADQAQRTLLTYFQSKTGLKSLGIKEAFQPRASVLSSSCSSSAGPRF